MIIKNLSDLEVYKGFSHLTVVFGGWKGLTREGKGLLGAHGLVRWRGAVGIAVVRANHGVMAVSTQRSAGAQRLGAGSE